MSVVHCVLIRTSDSLHVQRNCFGVQEHGTLFLAYKSGADSTFAALRMSELHKHWVFTSFDLTLEEKLPVLCDKTDGDAAKYVVYQRESAPDTGREHLQGYVEWPKRIAMRTCKLWLGDTTAHVEPRRGMWFRGELWRGINFRLGTRSEARAYAKKEETRIAGQTSKEFGVWTPEDGQGRRNDLDTLKRKLAGGACDRELLDDHFGDFIRYYRVRVV